MPYTFNIVGGRKPYLVTSSEPTIIELNLTTDSNQFTIVARNPGVVDVGLDPDEVPRRIGEHRGARRQGRIVRTTYNVLQNFFTGLRRDATRALAPPAPAPRRPRPARAPTPS